MFSFITSNLLWSEGATILVILLGLVWCTYKLKLWILQLGVLGLIFFSLFFFRNPNRICQEAVHDPLVLISPADGKVVDIQDTDEEAGYAQKVSIFLSVFDAHVNWAPIAGTIEDISYKPGQFVMAFLPKSSLLNERNDVRINHDSNGKSVLVRQIAGTIARRICCWVHPGQQVSQGEKYGMIRFGSRVDIFLPAEVTVNVGVGQRVYGGQTALARWQEEE